MAVKKSELYSTLWEGCNKLRGSMDASQYKNYVLIMLFLKYISDKAKAKDIDSLVEVPAGCTFDDIIKLKHKDNIGEEMNKILKKIAHENSLEGIIDTADQDFCNEDKLGQGKDLVKRVTSLIEVFQNSKLDFGQNRSSDDDLIGDAYEFLMRQFATESGKSKGQFYTPAEASRVLSILIGIADDDRPNVSIYDPTCGSGSLLLKAKAAAKTNVTINGQEMDNSNRGMALMNMIIHGVDTADIRQGDTLGNPQHKKDGVLQQHDYAVANPPFSQKDWMLNASEKDIYKRWSPDTTGVPPEKNGDYAFLLHLIASLKFNGKGAIILPHGVLFRGNAEENIRKYIVNQHWIKGIVGLPANLFYGTGIPACVIVIDKGSADSSKGIFFINAKDGFMKDGAKNRLREQDIKLIEDTWKQFLKNPEDAEVENYAHFATYKEIEKNGYNLNITRYVPSEDTEVLQDIEAHLKGGLPATDIEKMHEYWKACPTLKETLFAEDKNHKGYFYLKCNKSELRQTIENETSFIVQKKAFENTVKEWSDYVRPELLKLTTGIKPKELITVFAEDLLQRALKDKSLVDAYNSYNYLMNYWADIMQDDFYLISNDGWKANLVVPAKKTYSYKDLTCDLLPVDLCISKFFTKQKDEIEFFEDEISSSKASNEEILETWPDFDEYLKKNSKVKLEKYIEELKKQNADPEFIKAVEQYESNIKNIKDNNTQLKEKTIKLTADIIEKYKAFTEEEIKNVVVNDKWLCDINSTLNNEMQNITQKITSDVTELVERYENKLSDIEKNVAQFEEKVSAHLKEMGFEA